MIVSLEVSWFLSFCARVLIIGTLILDYLTGLILIWVVPWLVYVPLSKYYFGLEHKASVSGETRQCIAKLAEG